MRNDLGANLKRSCSLKVVIGLREGLFIGISAGHGDPDLSHRDANTGSDFKKL